MTTWKRIEDDGGTGYESGAWQIWDNGQGFGGSAGSGRWALTNSGKWIANLDTLKQAKERAAA